MRLISIIWIFIITYLYKWILTFGFELCLISKIEYSFFFWINLNFPFSNISGSCYNDFVKRIKSSKIYYNLFFFSKLWEELNIDEILWVEDVDFSYVH